MHCWSFSAQVSVDQDLTVVTEALDDDDVVKQWLVSIVFHAGVTQQRSNGSETRFSRSHVHEKKPAHPCKQGFEKKGPTQTDAENLIEPDDNYTLEQRNWKTFGSPLLRLHLMFKTKVLCNTDVLKIDQEDKMSSPCRHTSKH